MNTHMDRTIFRLKAGIPATSLYILICSLLDEGHLPTLDRIRVLWNGTEELLNEAIEELISRGVLESPPAWAGERGARLYLSKNWCTIVQPRDSSGSRQSSHEGWSR
jgi:hypothetical protein